MIPTLGEALPGGKTGNPPDTGIWDRWAMAGDNAVVIKRIKKGGHGGHHGGAWKVAYADFVTAMMAFFLLMWLINTTTPEQKRGIADYFAPQSISQTLSGAGGVLGGKVMGQEDARAGGAQSVFQRNSPPSPQSEQKSLQNAKAEAGQSTGSDSLNPSSSAAASRQDGQFASAAEAIHQSMQDMPELAKLSKQVITEITPEGLRIQLIDQDGRPMFQPGSAVPMPYTAKLLAEVGKIVDRLPNRIAIAGHTSGTDEGQTWEISSTRANAARSLLSAGGLSSDRIAGVTGKAGTEPLLPEDPSASANRRVSITLLREAPPVPLGHQIQ